MRYGVPQTARSKHSKRVQQLKLYADTAGEEIILTAIYDALESDNLEELALKLKTGREVKIFGSSQGIA